MLGGFSQGAVMAYSLGLGAGRPRPSSLLALSGFIPTVDGWEPDLESPFPPIAIAHGAYDPVIPVEFARAGEGAARARRRRRALPRVADRALDRPARHRRAPRARCARAALSLGSLLPAMGGGRMRKSITLFSLLALVAAVLVVAGTAGASRHSAKSTAFSYCDDPTFPPMESTTTAGKPVGFDIDMAAALAKQMGGTAKFVHTAFSGLLPALGASKCDVVISRHLRHSRPDEAVPGRPVHALAPRTARRGRQPEAHHLGRGPQGDACGGADRNEVRAVPEVEAEGARLHAAELPRRHGCDRADPARSC